MTQADSTAPEPTAPEPATPTSIPPHSPDLTARLARGVEFAQCGEKAAAAACFDQLWTEIGDSGDPLQRLTLAHWRADVCEDLNEELTWDLRALAAADGLDQDTLSRAGFEISVSALYPSLHLNLGEVYRKLGDLSAARQHQELGTAASFALHEDGYGKMIKGGLSALGERLERDNNPTADGFSGADQPA